VEVPRNDGVVVVVVAADVRVDVALHRDREGQVRLGLTRQALQDHGVVDLPGQEGAVVLRQVQVKERGGFIFFFVGGGTRDF